MLSHLGELVNLIAFVWRILNQSDVDLSCFTCKSPEEYAKSLSV